MDAHLTAEECLARLRDFDTSDRYRRLCRRIWGLREERRRLRERVKVLEDRILSLEAECIPAPYGER